MIIASHRFATRKQREGVWDETAPKHPLPTRPAGADLYRNYDGGLRRAWEQQHGPEGLPAPLEPAGPLILPPLDDGAADFL